MLSELFPYGASRALHFYVVSVVALVLAPTLLALRARAERRGEAWGPIERPLALTAIALFAAYLVLVVRGVVLDPPEWDFLAFWVRMNVAARGLDMYDPANYAAYASQFTLSIHFVQEVLELGFNYPPQTMLWLEPFGHLDPRPAALAWSALHLAALAINVVLLRRIFLPGAGAAGVALVFALMLMLPATASTLRNAQTNQLVLLLLLLFWIDRDRPRAGLWLALFPIVKPYLGLFWLWPLLRRQWRTVAITAGVSLVLAGAAALLYGVDVFDRFHGSDIVERHPNWAYTQWLNQSIHATMVRTFRVPEPSAAPSQYLAPAFVSAAVLVAAVWRSARAAAPAWPWAHTLLIVTALLVFPSSLRHYHLLLLPAMLLLWSERDRIEGGTRTALAVVGTTWLLASVPGGPWLFLAYAGWWAIAWVMAGRGRAAPRAT